MHLMLWFGRHSFRDCLASVSVSQSANMKEDVPHHVLESAPATHKWL